MRHFGGLAPSPYHCSPSSDVLLVQYSVSHVDQSVHDGLQFLTVLSNLTTMTSVRQRSNVLILVGASTVQELPNSFEVLA